MEKPAQLFAQARCLRIKPEEKPHAFLERGTEQFHLHKPDTPLKSELRETARQKPLV